ncbi:MAG: nucleotidyltransferase domain-containing protein [Desulfobacterales bacterium]|nr:nucleotidyltransferase domain-containing protein [Desulfobacterales bacterium]
MKPIHKNASFSDLILRAEGFLRSRKDVLFSYLFGSAASGKTHPMSDLDIAVYLDGEPTAEGKLDLLGGLIDAVKTDEIDLVVLNTAPLPLKARIIRSRRVLTDRAPFVRHAFESATMRAYLDFSKLETRILERRYLHGR